MLDDMVKAPNPSVDHSSVGLARLDRELPLSDRSYRALREQIAAGTLPPGERLTERGLALLLGVSPTPVREALRRLEQEGLISRAGPRTLHVVEHSNDALRELLFAEAVLRAAEARIAVAKIDDDGIARMTAAVQRLANGADATEDDVLATAAAFDNELTEAAANPALRAMIESAGVIGYARRVRAVSAMRSSAREIGKRHLQAHRDILAAVIARDADAVENLVRTHLLSSVDLLLDGLDPTDGTAA